MVLQLCGDGKGLNLTCELVIVVHDIIVIIGVVKVIVMILLSAAS